MWRVIFHVPFYLATVVPCYFQCYTKVKMKMFTVFCIIWWHIGYVEIKQKAERGLLNFAVIFGLWPVSIIPIRHFSFRIFAANVFHNQRNFTLQVFLYSKFYSYNTWRDKILQRSHLDLDHRTWSKPCVLPIYIYISFTLNNVVMFCPTSISSRTTSRVLSTNKCGAKRRYGIRKLLSIEFAALRIIAYQNVRLNV